MAVGVILALGWNMAASHQDSEAGSGVTPQVGLTVDRAAVQTWAATSPGGSPRAASDRAWMSGVPHGLAPTPR